MNIEGYDVLEPLGFGLAGTVWRVADRSGAQWAAKLATLDAAGRADQFARIHACGIRSMVPADLGRIAVISTIFDGEDVATLARRRSWCADNALDVVRIISHQLAQIHAAGLAHGDVSAANIVATRTGFLLVDPLLDEMGTTAHYRARELDELSRPTLAGDVYALGVIARDLGVHHSLCEQALSDNPRERPSSAQIAHAFARAGRSRKSGPTVRPRRAARTSTDAPCPPDPIRAELARSDDQRTRHAPAPTPRGGRLRRLALPIVGAAALVVGGIVLAQPDAAPANSATRTNGQATKTQAAEAALADHVKELVKARDDALVAADDAALARVTAPDSPARAADTELAASLRGQGITVKGLTTGVSGIQREQARGEGVWVRARLRQNAYQRCTAGQCEAVPAQPARTVIISLTATDGVVRDIAAAN